VFYGQSGLTALTIADVAEKHMKNAVEMLKTGKRCATVENGAGVVALARDVVRSIVSVREVMMRRRWAAWIPLRKPA
jgi:hypothetical protein